MSLPQADLLNIAFELVDTGEVVPISERSRLLLGRLNPGEVQDPQEPIFDLTPYAAYTAGVSRQHAVIEFYNHQVFIIDLGSTNGTRLNGKSLPTRIPYIIGDNDIITLGKIKIRVLVISS